MIARLSNMQRIYDEVTLHKLDCVNITNGDGKAPFGSRTGITPDEVNDFIRRTHADFSGEIMVEVWKANTKGTALKYVVSCMGGPSAVAGVGSAGMHPDLLRLMQANFDTKLEMERLRMQMENGKADNYMPQALQMIAQLLNKRDGAQPQPIAQPAHQDRANGTDTDQDEEPDVFDDFVDEEPDAYGIVERLLKLKKSNPALYAQAKGTLDNLSS